MAMLKPINMGHIEFNSYSKSFHCQPYQFLHKLLYYIAFLLIIAWLLLSVQLEYSRCGIECVESLESLEMRIVYSTFYSFGLAIVYST